MEYYEVICDGKNVGLFSSKQLMNLQEKHPNWVFTTVGNCVAIDRKDEKEVWHMPACEDSEEINVILCGDD